jgi:hypothetical protein
MIENYGMGRRPVASRKRVTAFAVFACLCGAASAPGEVAGGQAVGVSRVYYVLDPRVMGEGNTPDARIVRGMVDALVREVAGEDSVAAAWHALLKPADVVGIRVSTSAGPLGGTKAAVAGAVAAGLREAGFPRERIIVWDRNLADLLGNGFHKDAPDYTLRWIDPADGYDSAAAVSAPVLGKLIWGDSRFGIRDEGRLPDLLAGGEQLSSRSFQAKVLSREVTAVINIPSATDSFLTGVNGALATMTIGNLDNWRRFTKAPGHGDPYLAEIYADAAVGGKVVLTILDALIVQYAGGPRANPNFTVDNATLLASKDPVAIDATLLDMVDRVRTASKLPPVKPMAGHIESAAALGLGNNLPSRIEMIRAGMGVPR